MYILKSAAGWDWIAPVPDRNTGPWGSVFLAAAFAQDYAKGAADAAGMLAPLQDSHQSLRGREVPESAAERYSNEVATNDNNIMPG